MPNSIIGTVKAVDLDVGDNANIGYLITCKYFYTFCIKVVTKYRTPMLLQLADYCSSIQLLCPHPKIFKHLRAKISAKIRF